MKKIISKKIHFGFALLIILSLSIIPVSLFLHLAIFEIERAEAFFGTTVGLQINSIPIICVADITGGCRNCPICGDVADCEGRTEVLARPLNPAGYNALIKGQALCLNPGYQASIKRGFIQYGHRCAGIIRNLVRYTDLFTFSCTLAPTF